jgi:hypothetical protein
MQYNFHDTQQPELLNYILFYSSVKCQHSNNLIDYLKTADVDPEVQNRMTIMDIVERYNNNQEIPDYIDFVPALVISNAHKDEVESILYGDEIKNWAQQHKKKKSVTATTATEGSSNFAPRDCYTRHNFADNIELDKYGKPVDQDPSQFQISTEIKNKRDIQDDFMKFQEEYTKQNEEFGIHGNATSSASTDTDTYKNKYSSYMG